MELSKEQLITQVEISNDIIIQEARIKLSSCNIPISGWTEEELLVILKQNEALIQAIETRERTIQYLIKKRSNQS